MAAKRAVFFLCKILTILHSGTGNMGHFQRLEDLRIDHNLTQEEVAGLLHCQREVYRRYEKGIRKIPVDCVVTLAKYYRCSSDYILGLTNQAEPYVDSET